jgi:DNA-binding GntR family transcriptional regulator
MRKKQLQSRLKSLVAQVRLAARVRLVQTALAIERFRLRNGDIPENLEALTPDYIAADVLEDPFTGESLLYSIEEDHYVVYSVAEPRLNERYVNEGGTAPSAISFSIYF